MNKYGISDDEMPTPYEYQDEGPHWITRFPFLSRECIDPWCPERMEKHDH